MLHTIANIASHHYLDSEIAHKTAPISRHAFQDGRGFVVSTNNVENFVADVRSAQGGDDASDVIRRREIEKRNERSAAILEKLGNYVAHSFTMVEGVRVSDKLYAKPENQ